MKEELYKEKYSIFLPALFKEVARFLCQQCVSMNTEGVQSPCAPVFDIVVYVTVVPHNMFFK